MLSRYLIKIALSVISRRSRYQSEPHKEERQAILLKTLITWINRNSKQLMNSKYLDNQTYESKRKKFLVLTLKKLKLWKLTISKINEIQGLGGRLVTFLTNQSNKLNFKSQRMKTSNWIRNDS